MIALFTDYGLRGPYVGQMKSVLALKAPGVPVIDLMHDAPSFNVRAAAFLLAALAQEFPPATVFVAVVDPEVGTAERKPVMLQADGRWFVGPGNGLFELVARRARSLRWREIVWRPQRLSATFHGRDLFAPVAASLARGVMPEAEAWNPAVTVAEEWPEDLAEIIYIDDFGNAFTGLRAASVAAETSLQVRGQLLERQRTFGDAAPGRCFCYANSNGLMEIAANRASAAHILGLAVGDVITLVVSDES